MKEATLFKSAAARFEDPDYTAQFLRGLAKQGGPDPEAFLGAPDSVAQMLVAATQTTREAKEGVGSIYTLLLDKPKSLTALWAALAIAYYLGYQIAEQDILEGMASAPEVPDA